MKAFVTALGLFLGFSFTAQAYKKSYIEYETASWAKNIPGASIESKCRSTFAAFAARSQFNLRNVRLQVLSVPGYVTISGNLPNGRSCAMNCSRGYVSEVYCSN